MTKIGLLFNKATQRITIFNSERDILGRCVLHLKAKKLKGVKISLPKYADDEWSCVISCKSADMLYHQEILPMLYSTAETQSSRAMLELDDKSEPARRCPREIMASFDLKSQYAFGDKDDNEFMQKLRKDITQGVHAKTATVSYYIVSGGSVTMSIPCLELSEMKEFLQDKFKDYGIKRFAIDIVNREAA